MTTSQLYAWINFIGSIVYLVVLLIYSWRRREVIDKSIRLRIVYPVSWVVYVLFGVSYALILFMPSEADAIGRSVLRPAVPIFLLSFMLVILMSTDAVKSHIAAAYDLNQVEQERLQERQSLLQEREALLRDREQFLKERENFVVVVLHELRTPLSLLTGYAAMLATAESLEEARMHAGHILSGVGRFHNMTRLFEARLKSNHWEVVELCQLIDKALSDPYLFTATRLAGQDIHIEVQCPGDLILEADRSKLETAVFELVRNAIKASEKGDTVRVEGTASNGHVVVSVADNGAGIPLDFQSSIWDAGTQYFVNITSRRNEGAGYGLFTVRHIAEAHHGQAVLEHSAPGEGSRFALYLPKR